MENEKKNKAKSIISEVVYSSILGIMIIWALLVGYHQAKSSDKMLERLSNIEEKLSINEINNKPLARYDNAINDLSDTTWIFNDNLTAIGGFNATEQINFTSNGNNYTSLIINEDSSDMGLFLYYGSLSNEVFNEYGSGWIDNGYKTITITGGTDATNATFITWLAAHAAQEAEPDEPVAPVYKPLKLNSMYDMRQWFGQVDAMSGCVIMSSSPSISTPLIYDIGDLEINGVHYTHLGIAFSDMRGANIVVGYDFTNNTYLISTGAEYAPDATYIFGLLKVSLLTGNSFLNNKELNLYKAPMVGGLSKYETGGIIQTTGNTATSGLLLSQFKLNALGCDWSKYVPSSTKYTFLGLGSAQFTIYELLQMDYLNDTYMDFYSVGSQATGGSVFTLIGNAFSTLVPILSIQVIPGLPIGLLVCLPIVATIIVVVFKIVRK